MNHLLRLEVLLGGQLVGTLIHGQGREIHFQYDPGWVKSGFDLAPGQLRFTSAAQVNRDLQLFEGLHGVFADSLPDGWGLILMNRALQQRSGWAPEQITPLDRLAYIGNRGMGALEYRPAQDVATAPVDWLELERLGTEAELILNGSTQQVLEALRIHGGSPGGARPKVLVALNPGLRECHSSLEPLPAGFSHWLVKFRGVDDPMDMGAIEFAYSQMAQAAGLRVPRSTLLPVRLGGRDESIFAVERFDRNDDEKVHVLSLATYANANFREPCLDYDQVLGATMAITRDMTEVEQAFRLMVFNVLAHNQDDHAKNFAFLWRDGRWHLAPAYDLTFSTVRAYQAQHWTSVNGKGLPARADVLKLARNHGVQKAEQIIEQVRAGVARWAQIGQGVGVSDASLSGIANAVASIDKRFEK